MGRDRATYLGRQAKEATTTISATYITCITEAPPEHLEIDLRFFNFAFAAWTFTTDIRLSYRQGQPIVISPRTVSDLMC